MNPEKSFLSREFSCGRTRRYYTHRNRKPPVAAMAGNQSRSRLNAGGFLLPAQETEISLAQ
jgi:hypothetical protein